MKWGMARLPLAPTPAPAHQGLPGGRFLGSTRLSARRPPLAQQTGNMLQKHLSKEPTGAETFPKARASLGAAGRSGGDRAGLWGGWLPGFILLSLNVASLGALPTAPIGLLCLARGLGTWD